MALDVKPKTNNGFERQTENMALNAKQKRDMMALNVELRTNDDSECQTEDATLNVKMKIQL